MSQATKSKKRAKQGSGAAPSQPAKTTGSTPPAKTAGNSKTASAPPAKKAKHRSTLLAIALVAVALHGIFMAFVYWTSIPDAQRTVGNVALWVMFLAAAADVVAAGAMWFWKKWGIYLYGAAAVVTAAMSVLATGNVFLVFGALLPAIIVLYIVMRERGKFE
jgi:hypothetical protein